MTRYFCLSGGLTLILAMSCAQQNSPLENLPVSEHASPPPEPDPSQRVIRGSWALPVAPNDVRIPGGKVERRDQEIRVSLAVEDFEKPGFDRSGYWDQSGIYEHAYGGDRSGSLSYRFTGMDLTPQALKIKARLSAESQTQGKPNETSDVTLMINGVSVGKQTVVPDNGIGLFYVWHVTDPAQIRKLNIAPGTANELRFVVSDRARNQHGLCIYGKALEASAPEPGEPLTIIYRLAQNHEPSRKAP